MFASIKAETQKCLHQLKQKLQKFASIEANKQKFSHQLKQINKKFASFEAEIQKILSNIFHSPILASFSVKKIKIFPKYHDWSLL